MRQASMDLTERLHRNLKRNLADRGSTLWRMTWRRLATPSGRLVYRLVPLARRTLDSDYSSWPTPNAGPQNDQDSTWEALKAEHKNGNGFGLTLGMAASLAPWPTPNAMEGGQTSRSGKRKGEPLMGGLVRGASWATPAARDWHSESATEEFNEKRWGHTRGKPLSAEATLLGPISSGSPAETAKPGQLNPAFSLWLMGYGTAWARCAAQVTRSSRKRLPPSSKRT